MKRVANITSLQECSLCNGTGRCGVDDSPLRNDDAGFDFECPRCGGSGVMQVPGDPTGYYRTDEDGRVSEDGGVFEES